MKNNFYLISICFSILLFGISCKEKPLFEKIETSHSNIGFSNRIIDNDTLSILNFEYIYNGAGVGVGDFNNDGLQDLFFSGNQVANKLYLNKGNFQFEDITKAAGLSDFKRWFTGVTIVDINADGLTDIYVSATARKSAEERQNMLFVNQGIKNGKPSFKEMAAEYGINDDGHSENASFFDYDNDGDLDLYVLTNIIDEYPNIFRKKVTDGTYPNTDKLYRCDWDDKLKHPVYKNVSKQAGITIEGYGLGLNICDINKDGWKDIYVTNDYAANDLLYINNRNGTFTDHAKDFFKHTSNSAMGNDVADINNDGFLDMISVDMLAKNNLRKKVLAQPNNYQIFNFSDQYGYIYQYMRNTLQLNNGVTKSNSPAFSEISLLAGVAETDWSWTPSLADFDNDGYKDLLITNGFPKDVTDRDFMAFRSESGHVASKSFVMSQIPEVKISNYAFRNKGDLTFENVTEKWGLNIPSFSNGAVYADLDNDGDLDYVVNNINDSAFVYKNTLVEQKIKDSHFIRIKCVGDKLNINGVGAVLELTFENGEKIIHENNPSRGYLSSVEPFVHIGLGNKKVRSIKIKWYNGFYEEISKPEIDKILTLNVKNAKLLIEDEKNNENKYFSDITEQIALKFKHQEQDFIDFNTQNLLPFKLSELGPGMSVGDLNGDGLEDIFVGGAKSFSSAILFQKSNGKFETKYLMDTVLAKSKISEDLGSLIFDADNDNDLDIYVCRGGNEDFKNSKNFQDILYENDSKGNFKESQFAIPQNFDSNSCVRAADFDKDGDLDLIVAGRNTPNEYPKFTNTILLRNDSKAGKIKFSDITPNEFKNLGLVCDVLFSDYDNDGWIDLVMASDWSAIKFFKNTNGKFQVNENSGINENLGLWNSINGADFDSDGDIDYIVGNVGQNNLIKGTKDEPTHLLAKDFDSNGIYDVIPFVYFNDVNNKRKLVPFNGKDDVNKQLNVTRQRFVTYKDFSRADFDNLLTKDEKQDAQDLTLNYASSAYIENLGNGKFKIHELPIYAQLSAVNGILIDDFNMDSKLDVLISGNNYGAEISTGRMDASNGILLLGNGQGNFKNERNSGMYLPGNAKAVVSYFSPQNQKVVLGSQNRGEFKFFQSLVAGQYIKTPYLARKVYYELKGKKINQEIYYGSSYLSQSSRNVILPAGAKNVKFIM